MTCYEVRVYGGQCEVSSTMIKSGDIIMESVYIRSPWHKRGALEGESPCRMSILRNGNVTCFCHLFSSMSHVDLKKMAISNFTKFLPSCQMSLSLMSCRISILRNHCVALLNLLRVEGHKRLQGRGIDRKKQRPKG